MTKAVQKVGGPDRTITVPGGRRMRANQSGEKPMNERSVKNILLASLGAAAACANDPLYDSRYDDPVGDMFSELRNNRNSNAKMCSYRFDAIEAAAATLDEAIRKGDATRYASGLDELNSKCDGFYSVNLFPDSFPRPPSGFIRGSCADALRKAGDPTIGLQMVERAKAVCEVARSLPAIMPDQPDEYEQWHGSE